MLTAIINNWSNCTVLCVKKGRIIGKDKLNFLHDNAPSHTSTIVQIVQNYLETLNWEVLSHPAYSTITPDLAPSDYHLFSSMGYALAERHFDSYEDIRKWLDEWFTSKGIFLAWYTQIAWKMGKIYS